MMKAIKGLKQGRLVYQGKTDTMNNQSSRILMLTTRPQSTLAGLEILKGNLIGQLCKAVEYSNLRY
jgi:hypothetical protein